MDKTIAYIEANKDTYLEELVTFLKIQSVSSDSTKDQETRRAADWVAERASRAGIENVRVVETGGHPAVYGDWLHAEGKPTILVYGHYDVQPAKKDDGWDTEPFEPTVKDGQIYGRGTSDDKGQLVTHLYALEALLKTEEALPVNIKFFIEGEEEAGSEHTEAFVDKNRDLLKCDAVVISDTAWHAADLASMVYALRGLAYFEVVVRGPNRDLHSGTYGGKLQNPLNAIGKIIAKLQDEDGRILVDGWYDDVLPLTDEERSEFATVRNEDDHIKADLGISDVWGEKGYSTNERNWGRPSMDIHGMWGGHMGEGAKTVIASEGGFKVSSRLVANQSPEKMQELFAAYLEKITPPGVEVDVKFLHGATPVMIPTDNFFIQAARGAMEKGFGKRPILVREGASIPITAAFLEMLNAPSVLIGYGLTDDNIHGPNEKLSLDHFFNGIKTNAFLYAAFAEKT